LFKEYFSFGFVIVACWLHDRLALLGNYRRGKEFGEGVAYTAFEPHVEKVRESSIRHVIVVRGICYNSIEVIIGKR
jgi:hypothetical protein